ncbi:MAG: Spy0128 family protein [Christensenellales bacterium]|jgi:pilin isopeptide linkage protein
MKRQRNLRKPLGAALVAALAAALLLAGLPLNTARAATYGDNLALTAANDWQIASGGYAGNGPFHKTTVSEDGMVRVQKNVVPTDTENVFKVYLSLDAVKKKIATYESITGILELNIDSLYCGGTGNGFPKTNDDVRTGNGSLNNGVQGGEKPITFSPTSPTFTIQIWYNGQLIAEPQLQMVVPNSGLYLKVGEQYIALECIQQTGHGITIGGQTPEILPDGSYLVPVYLTDMAFDALSTTVVNEETEEETVIVFEGEGSATITDTMGDYIVYNGFAEGDIAGAPPPAAAQTGTTVTWSLSPKAAADITMTDPVQTVTEETVIGVDGTEYYTRVTTTTQWYLNAAEVVYNVYLDVAKAGFTSGTVYDVNGPTALNYTYDNALKSLTFPVPKVRGTLYDIQFKKEDSVTGIGLAGAVFTLVDADNIGWPATASGEADGVWHFTGLPMGTYTLTEVTPPAGYELPATNTWTLDIGYTEDLKDGQVTDHIHDISGNDKYIGQNEACGHWHIRNDLIKGGLAITKTVTAGGGLTAPAASFDIKVTFMKDGTPWDATANGVTYSIGGSPEAVWPSDGVITLQAGQTATLSDILPGVTYTVTEQNIPAGFAITAATGLNGTIVTNATQQAGITNNYTVRPYTLAEGSIGINKELTGANLAAGAFRFTLAPVNGGPMPANTTVSNDAAGTAHFDEIIYTAPGVYTYTIIEVDGGLAGYTYDNKTLGVTVTVTDNGDGTMSAEVEYNDDVTFNNSYEATGCVQITAMKHLSGRALADGQFTFTLTPVNGAPGSAQTKTNAAGQIVFDEVCFDQTDMGTTVVTRTYALRYMNGTTGEYEDALPQGAIDNGDGTWTYTPPGEDPVIYTAYYVNVDDESDALTELPAGAVDNGDGTWSVTTEEQNMFAAFTYTITEVIGSAAGYTYDSHTETVTVNVTDDGGGTLTATAMYDADGAVFNNSYAAAGSVSLGGTKTVTGKAVAAEQFTFNLIDSGNNVIRTAKNDADGNFTFGALNYTQSDAGMTYTYTIAEVNDGQGGYTYDSKISTVTVTIVDNGDGTLTVTPNYSPNADFTNTYAATGSGIFSGRKAVEGTTLTAGRFTFNLLDEHRNVIRFTKNNAAGDFAFAPVLYTLADVGKTHTYYIVEVDDGQGGYTYDSREIEVTVTVTDNGDGTLTATPAYSPEANFNNSYAATGSATFSGSKTLNGGTLAENQFTFNLLDESRTAIRTAKNDATGNFTFAPVNYTLADVEKTHTYYITEVDDGQPRITYDNHECAVFVTLIDNGDGTLTPILEFAGETTFVNTEDPPLNVSVHKMWECEPRQHPKSVTVQLYRDGTAYGDAVALNKDNLWYYEWTNLDEHYAWTVDEPNVPSGFVKRVTRDGNSWTITNVASALPPAGDDNRLFLWILLMSASVAGIAGIVLFGRKEKQRGKS